MFKGVANTEFVVISKEGLLKALSQYFLKDELQSRSFLPLHTMKPSEEMKV